MSGAVAQAMRYAGCPNRRSLGVREVFPQMPLQGKLPGERDRKALPIQVDFLVLLRDEQVVSISRANRQREVGVVLLEGDLQLLVFVHLLLALLLDFIFVVVVVFVVICCLEYSLDLAAEGDSGERAVHLLVVCLGLLSGFIRRLLRSERSSCVGHCERQAFLLKEKRSYHTGW